MSVCGNCGAPQQDGVAEGLCPRCLLAPDASPSTSPAPGWTPPAVADLAPRFPQLEIVALVGQGGMGAVYKARQPHLDRFVALKVLPPELGAAPQFAERFAREARTLARLAHQNVVGIHDFGDADGLYFVVMEFVEGRSLRELLAGGRLRPEHALRLVPQICDGLQYAHDAGVIHRDIKPENILVDAAGRVRIADFGLAKLVSATAPAESLTGTHQVMGTLHYMAPEQMERPGDIDHRVDLYALGVVFYEMLTGKLPLGKFPPPSRESDVGAGVDDAVLKSLERQREDRHDSALDFKRALDGPAPARERAPSRAPAAEPATDAAVLKRILVAGLVGFVMMFVTWGSVPFSKLQDAMFGAGRDMFGDRNDPGHPFHDEFFDREPGRLTNVNATFGAWDVTVLGIPAGLAGLICAALAVLAGIGLNSGRRFPWTAYAIPAAAGLALTLGALFFFLASSGAPYLGSLATFAALVVLGVGALQLRPKPAPVNRARPRRPGRDRPRPRATRRSGRRRR